MARIKLHSAWTDWSLRAKGLIVIAIPMLALLLIAPAAYFSAREDAKTSETVERSLAVVERIEDTRALIFESVARMRGYVLTDDPTFLELYEGSARELPGAIARLRMLPGGGPEWEQQVDGVESVTLELLGNLEETRAPSARPELAALVGRTREQTEDLQARLDEMRDEVESLLSVQRSAAGAAQRRETLVIEVIVLVGILVGSIAIWMFTTGITRRMQLIRDNAFRLARQEPLTSLPGGRDEIASLGEALEDASQLLRERSDALRESEARLRALIDNSTSVIFMKDADGRFLVINRVFESLFGISRDEAIGKTVHDLFDASDADLWRENDLQVMRGRVPAQFEEVAPAQDGERVFLSTKVPLLDEHGEPSGLVGISTDITDRKRAEEEVRRYADEAERANRAKSEFLSRMSHELRTPLNAILGFAQLLEMDELEGDQNDNVVQILKAGRHLLDLINEVLEISRIEAGRLSLSPEPVRVADALREALELVKPLAADKGVAINLAADVDGTHVVADRQRLKQVLLNLLANAVKYNREAGSVTLDAELAEDRFWIHVSDTGPGIAPADLERLFTPFDRLAHAAGTTEGTGLGLALSKGLVEAMGGSISVASTLGAGSVFTVELPLAENPIARFDREQAGSGGAQDGATTQDGVTRQDGAAPEEEIVAAGTILYIEDNLSNLRLIERMLERRPGIRLLSALQGSVGIDVAREHRPDLVLLDVHLPDMNGADVLKALRQDERTQDLRVVVISADATSSQVRRLMSLGASAYMTKPLDLVRFLELVDAALAGEDQPDGTRART
jgi:PAS domain S-box-containing protein